MVEVVDALALEVRKLSQAVTELHRSQDLLVSDVGSLLSSLRPASDGHEAAFCVTLLDSWGAEPFWCSELLEWIRRGSALRAPLKEATQELCRLDFAPTPVQLGKALRRLSSAPPPGFAVESRDVRGTTQWLVRRL